VLGIFRTQDAPVFGFDVSVQKARSAAFFTRADTGTLLRSVGLGSYVDRAVADGVTLTATSPSATALSDFYIVRSSPDDIDGTPPGPFSTPNQ
jgi:hypothetical protein